jgi:hypothetical protein
MFSTLLITTSLSRASSKIVLFLTTPGAGTFTVPANWNSANNSIECISGGSGGDNGFNEGSGGGGGGYAKITNLSLTPGSTINFSVGAGGAGGAQSTTVEFGKAGGDTWFNGSSVTNSSIGTKGASAPSGANGGSGGGTTGTGSSLNGGVTSTTTSFAGGSGGNSNVTVDTGGGGGGGSAGKFGAGANGGADITGLGNGGGGGGADGGTVGGAPTVSFGGTGGMDHEGIGGGAATSADATPGGNGSLGGGGGGAFDGPGGNGGAGNEWTATNGAIAGSGGGGAGGSGFTSDIVASGGSGGLYGGGGGGGGFEDNTAGTEIALGYAGGNGAQGIIVITYTPVPSILDTLSAIPPYAYSLRTLTETYTGPLITIQRASDNTTQSFSAVSGMISTSAIATFISGTTGTVIEWFNQGSAGSSGNLNTSAPGSFPMITSSSGNVATQGGQPALFFPGPDTSNSGFVSGPTFSVWSTATSANFVFAESSQSNMGAPLLGGNEATLDTVVVWAGSNFSGSIGTEPIILNAGSDNEEFGTSIPITVPNILTFTAPALSGHDLTLSGFLNGTSIGTTEATGVAGTPPTGFSIGLDIFQETGVAFQGTMTEVIIWESVVSTSDRELLEANQGAFYGVSGF